MADNSTIRGRIDAQVNRQPHLTGYPMCPLDLAVESVLERLEEQDYNDNPHDWVHFRPELLRLLDTVVPK